MGAPVASQGWTQSVRALSSAESELYGIGSGTAEGLHIRSFLMESTLAKSVSLVLYTDSSSAKSIAMQFGTSRKTRHIQLKYLYMQDLVASNIVQIKKIKGEDNPSDLMTKFVTLQVLRKHIHRLGLFNSKTTTINRIGNILQTFIHDDDQPL